MSDNNPAIPTTTERVTFIGTGQIEIVSGVVVSAPQLPDFQIVIKSDSTESSISTSTSISISTSTSNSTTDTVANPQQSSSSATTSNTELQSSSSSVDKEELLKTTSLLNSLVYTEEFLLPKVVKQAHLKRLQSLRKELNFVKDSDWMYDSME